eukprot:203247-Lingulodinium_polyedra.AAC.1
MPAAHAGELRAEPLEEARVQDARHLVHGDATVMALATALEVAEVLHSPAAPIAVGHGQQGRTGPVLPIL